MTAPNTAGLVERLRAIADDGDTSVDDSNTIARAADALLAQAAELAAKDDELVGERWHADEAARQRDVATRQRDEALAASPCPAASPASPSGVDSGRVEELLAEYGDYDPSVKLGEVFGTCKLGEFVALLCASLAKPASEPAGGAVDCSPPAAPAVDAIFRVTKRGVFIEHEPLLPAFDLPDGVYDLYAHPAPATVESVRALPYLIHLARQRWDGNWSYTLEELADRWLAGQFHNDAAESDAKAAALAPATEGRKS